MPLRENGLLNLASNVLTFNGQDVRGCAATGAEYQTGSCAWVEVPNDIIVASANNLRGHNVGDLRWWREVEDNLIRLNLTCDTLSNTPIQFCVSFYITLDVPPPTTTPPPPVAPTTLAPDPCFGQ